jgi:membrane fusion protein (multidrug efflux system)
MKSFYLQVICVSLITVTACSQKEKIEQSINEFPVTYVISKDTVLVNEHVVDVHAIRHVEIRARVPGYLDVIHVDEGQAVKAGQLLFKINDEEYRAHVLRAKASLHAAKADVHAIELEVERVSMLVDKKVISETELRLAKAKVDIAKAKVEEAQSDLSQANIRYSHTDIRAPFDGVVDRIPFKIGSLIDEGHLLSSIFDSNFIYAYFRVSEKEYLQYAKSELDERRSNNVELIQADGSTHQYPGHIETLEGEFDTSTGTIAFRAKFPNPDHILKHGSTGKIRLFTRVEAALVIPQKSTFEIQDKTYVFMVGADNKARVQSFLPSSRLAHFYIVQSGLNEGDRIIYEGIKNVRDGMLIKSIPVSDSTQVNSTGKKKSKTS